MAKETSSFPIPQLTRRQFLETAAFGLGLTVLGVTGAVTVRALGTDGNVKPADIPRGLLPIQKEYTDDQIETAVTSKDVVPGANAIMADQRASQIYAIPVHIVPQSPGTGIVHLEYKIDNQIYQSQTTPDTLFLPKRPLKNWLPADISNLPKDSAVNATKQEVNHGITWINALYRDNGVSEQIFPVADKNITWQPNQNDNAPQPQTVCNESTRVCTMNQPLILYGESVLGADGSALSIDGKEFIYRDYQTALTRVRQLSDELHENIHTTHAITGIYKDYYATNRELNWRLEIYTMALASMALGQYRRAGDIQLNAIIDKYDYPENAFIVWSHKIADDLTAKGENGLHQFLSFGAKGDMVGLQKLYDEYYGEGSFIKLPTFSQE